MMSKYKAIGHLTEIEEKGGVYVASRLYTFHKLNEIMRLLSDIGKISEVEYAIGIGEAMVNDLHNSEVYEFTGRLNTSEKVLIGSLHKFYGSLKIKHDDAEYLIGIEKVLGNEDTYWVVISTEHKNKKKAHKNLNKLLLELELY